MFWVVLLRLGASFKEVKCLHSVDHIYKYIEEEVDQTYAVCKKKIVSFIMFVGCWNKLQFNLKDVFNTKIKIIIFLQHWN